MKFSWLDIAVLLAALALFVFAYLLPSSAVGEVPSKAHLEHPELEHRLDSLRYQPTTRP